MQTRLRILF